MGWTTSTCLDMMRCALHRERGEGRLQLFCATNCRLVRPWLAGRVIFHRAILPEGYMRGQILHWRNGLNNAASGSVALSVHRGGQLSAAHAGPGMK